MRIKSHKKIVLASVLILGVVVLSVATTIFLMGETKVLHYSDKSELTLDRVENGDPNPGTTYSLLRESMVPDCATDINFEYDLDTNQYSLSYKCVVEVDIESYLVIANEETRALGEEWVFSGKKGEVYKFHGRSLSE